MGKNEKTRISPCFKTKKAKERKDENGGQRIYSRNTAFIISIITGCTNQELCLYKKIYQRDARNQNYDISSKISTDEPEELVRQARLNKITEIKT